MKIDCHFDREKIVFGKYLQASSIFNLLTPTTN